ncbi:MAG: TIGR03435 family protein [Acidobacteriaceae bacterium]|jgi:uncharacterized protein (TIGR03435 family)
MARLAAVLVLLMAVWVGAAAGVAAAQGTGNREQETASTAAAGDAADAVGHGFEVATVRPANRNDGRRWFGTEMAPSGRFSVSSMTLASLVDYAYVGMQKVGRVEGGPKWADSDVWDIEAKLDEADMAGWDKLSDRERMERVRPQLRALLVERFKLKVHSEMKVTAVYALVQAKGGVKMKEVDGPPANMDPQQREEWMRTGKTADGPMPGSFTVSDKGWVGHAEEVSALTGQIAYDIGATDKMMVDETGLEGHYYDFSIKLTREKDGPTMEQQIEDGLGLRVEERKVPVRTYVIDEAERPGEN